MAAMMTERSITKPASHEDRTYHLRSSYTARPTLPSPRCVALSRGKKRTRGKGQEEYSAHPRPVLAENLIRPTVDLDWTCNTHC